MIPQGVPILRFKFDTLGYQDKGINSILMRYHHDTSKGISVVLVR